MNKFTHLTEDGKAQMVDVSQKVPTAREAIARGKVVLGEKVFQAVVDQNIPKGDLFATARIAGILAAKKTANLIPLCHPLPLTKVEVDFSLSPEDKSLNIEARAKTVAQTGVEMEALTAVSVAALTVYDMCKGIDKALRITEIRLVKKTGGKSGTLILE
ncbi:cyclic pyranopterin monophosphate synthase MoaC [Thermodesulfatator autotrophicus]|uniref:Cyclic pyranopterin monophosphate synthase n=1 Tax=Thermodesulfatator autotrophicus TaxID=1795632 RepID=A0A177E902_9BACT|nr:cyclic pyranopterin monophosphate synthase MoaC [Thermodesulfatator autotrophicus]OAG27890.1 cyclic pyranopterin monophosphate synthase accessory protein [Thermodesulfatator autotrophicus]